MKKTPRIALTTGDPAGIGPDLCLSLLTTNIDAEIVLVGDPAVLQTRADLLKRDFVSNQYHPDKEAIAGTVTIAPVPVQETVLHGQLNNRNSQYVLNTLDIAIDGCLTGEFDAMVTCPIHKGVINDAGIPFTGHTEYLAERTQSEKVVMVLASQGLRVALATTHLPLRDVPDTITEDLLVSTLTCLHQDLVKYFGLKQPHILVAGLNPHAGEDGHMGTEEITTISPVLEKLRNRGFSLEGPLPADTLFTPPYLERADAVLAMYHDQGLPVLKHLGFGNAVNITFGLPIIRTSVDHGTALSLAGTGNARNGSLLTAIDCSLDMIKHG
ncbi:MAG: 4-hydroxythreonine-4-phosphate dehydrogenase PdxA [Gammaproteobacteria bacterium]